MADAELKRLKYERGQLKAELTRFEKFLNTVDTMDQIENIEFRSGEIQTLLDKFKTSQTQIEIMYLKEFPSNFDEAEAENEREIFENRYYAALSKSKQISIAAAATLASALGGCAPPLLGDLYDVTYKSPSSTSQPALPSVTARLP